MYGENRIIKNKKELYGKDNCRVLDTSSGFGGRLLGFFTAKNTAEYIGIDPNTADSCNKFIEFMQMRFGLTKKAYVNRIGSEDFTIDNYPQYENYFDISFTSPPYFDTEKYSKSDTQSYVKFNTYDSWVDGFYMDTIYNSCNALKLDGTFAINIFEKVDNIKEYTIPTICADDGSIAIKKNVATLSSTNNKIAPKAKIVNRT